MICYVWICCWPPKHTNGSMSSKDTVQRVIHCVAVPQNCMWIPCVDEQHIIEVCLGCIVNELHNVLAHVDESNVGMVRQEFGQHKVMNVSFENGWCHR